MLLLTMLMTASIGIAQKTVKFDVQTSEARSLELYPSTFIQPLVAEVIVDAKTGRIHDVWTLSPEDYKAREIPENADATFQNLKVFGMFKSSEKHNCDIIVAPTFDIRITNEGATINIVGYPANFANWKTGTKADFEWIELARGLKTVGN